MNENEARQNVEIMRDASGKLAVLCDGKRLYGVSGINVDDQKVVIALPLSCVRFGELGPRSVASDSGKIIPHTVGGGENL